MALKCWVLVLSFFTPSFAFASFVKSYGVKFGAVAANQSWNFSGAATGFLDPDRDRWGFDIGGYLELFGRGAFCLQPELHYLQKGTTYKIAETSYNYPTGTGKFVVFRPLVEYLSLPILLKFRPVSLPVNPYFVAGPRFDFLIGKNPEGLHSVYDRFSRVDYGADFGAGIEAYEFSLELRYSPTFNASYRDRFLGDELEIKNRSVELLLGIKL